MRRRDIDLAHAGMQPLERIGVVGRRDLTRCHGFVVGPQRDHEAITLVHTWCHSRLKSGHRTPDFCEPLSKINLELCDLMRYRCHLGHNVTGQQTHSEPVRIMKNDRVIDYQIQ